MCRGAPPDDGAEMSVEAAAREADNLRGCRTRLSACPRHLRRQQQGLVEPSAFPAARGLAGQHRDDSISRATIPLMRTSFFIALLLTTPLFAQQDFSKVEVKAQKVAGSVYMLTGSGGNIGVSVGEDGIVIVDDQFAPLAPKIKEALKGITDKPLRVVINTHFHGDHTGGNAAFGTEATIIAHDNVRKRLQEGGTVGGNSVAAAPKEALPVVTFNDRATVHVNGEDIRAIHVPNGHTDGDAVIFFPKANV